MSIDNIIKFERLKKNDHLMEKLTLLSLFSIGVFISTVNGKHIGICLGFFIFEFDINLRMWLKKVNNEI